MPYRAVLGAITLVLVAALGGAAGQAPPRAPAIIPAGLGDETFLYGDRLYLIASGRAEGDETTQNRVVTTYQLPEARVIARTTIAVTGAVLGLEQIGDVLVLGYQFNTDGRQGVVAQAVGATTPLWRKTARFVQAATADGIALLDDGAGLIAVDVRTGALRWRVPGPAGGLLTPDGGPDGGYPRWLVLGSDSGQLATWDARTGRPLASTTLPTAAGLMWPVGDLVMVDVGNGYDAYRLPGLDRLWHTATDLSQSSVETDCGVIICMFRQQRGMTAVDPATGRAVWRSERWGYAEPFGSYLLAGAGPETPALSVLDPATGQVLGDFGDWQSLGPAGGGRLYGKKDAKGQYRIWYGLLDPATRQVEYLGTAERVSGNCQTAPIADPVLVCRLVDASYAVWHLR
ncbi:outer membrane protein assembly factor BamB family protein [Paractinoplanes ferrugineus]|uniref:outer membrane protein assembly factor BamB family protein n=1 Tax=Paractinoplanes ferrugineus TaxID=113564 RepID=UPI0019404088|nr:PQQ-binding-like beta-propeller repeat protein [Actinoplanes ferrugineus]